MQGMRYLGSHPLAAAITARMAALVPAVPDVSGYTAVAPGDWAQPLSLGSGGITLALDGTTGAITRLVMAGQAWADDAHALGRYIYKTFTDADYAANPTCCYGEAGRQSIANPNRTVTSPQMVGMWVDAPAAPTKLVAALTMPQLLNTAYGAPATLWLTVAASADGKSLTLDLQAFNKVRQWRKGASSPLSHLAAAHTHTHAPTCTPPPLINCPDCHTAGRGALLLLPAPPPAGLLQAVVHGQDWQLDRPPGHCAQRQRAPAWGAQWRGLL